MGPSGSGKTNVSGSVITSNVRIENAQFINTLTGDAGRRKAAGFAPTGQGATAYTIPYHGFRLVLVEIPGLHDAYRSDSEILRIIADWLTQRCVFSYRFSWHPPDAVGKTKISKRCYAQAHWDSLPPPNYRQPYIRLCSQEPPVLRSSLR